MTKLIAVSLLALVCGCASNYQELSFKETDQKTGVVTERRTVVRNRAVWDSKNTVDKIKTSNTAKSQSAGVAGVGEEATSTNTTSALLEGLKIIGSSAVKP
jgi:hypothetical protein